MMDSLINMHLVVKLIGMNIFNQIKSNLFSNIYKYKHVIHDEIYILAKKDAKEAK